MQFSVEMELHANRMISFFLYEKIVWLAFFIFLLLSREEDCQIKKFTTLVKFFLFSIVDSLSSLKTPEKACFKSFLHRRQIYVKKTGQKRRFKELIEKFW